MTRSIHYYEGFPAELAALFKSSDQPDRFAQRHDLGDRELKFSFLGGMSKAIEDVQPLCTDNSASVVG